MPKRADVLIVGGGVIGLSTAYYLASRFAATVTVIDRGPLAREASWAGAGIIPPGRPEGATSPFDRLRAISATLIATLSAELHERTGIDNGYRVTGGVELLTGHSIDTDAWSREGIEWQSVAGTQLQAVEPALAQDVGPAYYLPGMAQIRNPRHLKALIAATDARHVELRPGCPALSLNHEGGHITAVIAGNDRLVANAYVVAAGAWTDSVLAPLGLAIDCRPIRGQIALLRTQAPVLSRIVLAEKRYLVPRDDGRVLVGATEEDAGFDPSTTAAGIGDLLRFATGMVPALETAAVERCWAGLRPGSPDGLPTLGRMPGFDNLWVAAGHFRAGLQLSAATGLVMAEALTGRPTTLALEPFRAGRPRQSPIRPAFRS
jgi:glycine oxidase